MNAPRVMNQATTMKNTAISADEVQEEQFKETGYFVYVDAEQSEQEDQDQVPVFLRNLPSFNPKNFSTYKPEASLLKKEIEPYISTTPEFDSKVIMNDEQNILLRYLRRTENYYSESGIKRSNGEDRGDRKRPRLSERLSRPTRET